MSYNEENRGRVAGIRPSCWLLVLILSLGVMAGCGANNGIVIDGSQAEGVTGPNTESLTFSTEDVAELESDILFVVLHATGTDTAVEAFANMERLGASTHFIIDTNGVIYQPLDAAFQANHTELRNPQSLSVHLVNPLPDIQEGDQINPDWLSVGYPAVVSSMINGVAYASLAYTDAQHVSLIALLRDIERAYPGLASRTPMTLEGEVVSQTLVLDPQAGGGPFRGVVGHWHLEPRTWEPGPGLDWPRIQAGISTLTH